VKRDPNSPSVAELAAYMEGELGASDRAEVAAELAASPALRARLERLRALREGLSTPGPALERMDLTSGVRDAIRRGARAPQRRPRRMLWASGSLLAVAAGVALAIHGVSTQDSEFRAKSARSQRASWAGFQAYRVPRAGAPEPLGKRLGKDDGLAFSYTNLGPAPFSYLLIFARDARGELRWFEPAYEHAGSDPTSLPIAKGANRQPIPEVISQDFAPGPLEIHAVFSPRPVRVLDVEKRLTGARTAELGFADSVEQSVWTSVEP
jgi:hypothetical protein